MLEVLQISPNSPFFGAVQAGDTLRRINAKKVHDLIDYIYLTADDELELEFSRRGRKFSLLLERDYEADLGLEFPPMKPTECGNDCIFCFVHQNPPHTRKAILVKDEDYRHSFLYGNYITLSNLGNEALKRIREYRLSPLYVSVHAMNQELRRKMLGRKKDDGFLRKFRALAEAGIILHCQIVIVPGVNDGEILKETIEQLSRFYPSAASIGLIPVGLTRHRENSPQIEPVSPERAKAIITIADDYRARFQSEFGDPLVYAADEMYLKTDIEIPPDDYYRDYPQIENGIGMVRQLLDGFSEENAAFPRRLGKPFRLALVTGKAMAQVMNKYIAPELAKIENLSVIVTDAPNGFFGESVSVAGLLGGRDILEASKKVEADLFLLPPDCLNYDQKFIDDMSLEQFQDSLKIETMIFRGSFSEVLDYIEGKSE